MKAYITVMATKQQCTIARPLRKRNQYYIHTKSTTVKRTGCQVLMHQQYQRRKDRGRDR